MGYPICEPLVLYACSSAFSVRHALSTLAAPCLYAHYYLQDIGHALLVPRRVEPPRFSSITLVWVGCPQTRVKRTAVLFCNFNSLCLGRNALFHASCSLRAYLWYWYRSMVSILVRARVLSARGMFFLCIRMVEPLGWCWYSMGVVWYVVRYGVAWCVVWHGM